MRHAFRGGGTGRRDALSYERDVSSVLSRVPGLSEDQLTDLAGAWSNGTALARARSRALSADLLPVVDILRAFDDVAHLYADDLDGCRPDGEPPTLDPSVVSAALKAVRDAIAGVIAAPALSRRDHALLTEAWRAVMGNSQPVPDAPTTDSVERLLGAVATLTLRCHDRAAAERFDQILLGAMTRDRDDHALAVTATFRAALATSRHRTWSLVRTRVDRQLAASCRTCPQGHGFDAYDRERVAQLCADAASAVLVADTVEPRTLDVLLQPLSGLVPFPRPPLGA